MVNGNSPQKNKKSNSESAESTGRQVKEVAWDRVEEGWQDRRKQEWKHLWGNVIQKYLTHGHKINTDVQASCGL